MGDSAGGNLTIELTNKLIQNKEKIPVSILLLYPVIDDKINTLSKTEFVNTPMWNSKNNEKMWKYYLKDKKYISPFTFCTLNKFPSTYIEVCEFDPLKDEGVEFANVLKNKGVDVILNETKDTLHGFDISPTSMTKKAFIERIKFINKI